MEAETRGATGIPKGWVWTNLGNLIEPSKEKVDPRELNKVSYLGLKHIEPDKARLLGRGYSDEVRSTKSVFRAGDLLYGKLRPYLNKVYVAEFDGICSTDILVFLQTPFLSTKYLLYRLLSRDFVGYASHNVSGVQHPRVNYRTLAKFLIPLAPLPEQHRIVAKIEELFTKLDAGVESLKTAKEQLRTYRISVLKAAVEGRLTEKWREQHRGEIEPASILLERTLKERRRRWEEAQKAKRQLNKKRDVARTREPLYRDPVDVAEISDPRLPHGWTWTNLDTLTYFVVDYRGKTPPMTDSGIPIISAANVKGGRIVVEKPRFVSPETYEKWTTRGLPRADDLIITTEAPVGETALYPEGTHLLTRRVLACQTNGASNHYLEYCFTSEFTREYLRSKSRGTTVPRILKPALLATPIPLPPLPEQAKIVEEAGNQLSMVGRMEGSIRSNMKRAERLRQSILKRAFSGKLVPQDPSDEPASVLLKSIRKQRERPESENVEGGPSQAQIDAYQMS